MAGKISAQVIPPDTSESEEPDIRIGSEYSLLPVAGYTSDLGLFGGGLVQRIGYGNNVRPFLSNLQANFTASTKGSLVLEMEYERTRTFGTDLRSLIDFTGQRIREAYYFGIGNKTEFSDQLFDDNYYFFENRELAIYYQLRKRMASFGEYGFLDLTGSVDVSYLNGRVRDESSKFGEDMPRGIGKSWANKAGFGFIADSRDSEFSPAQGIRYEASFEVSSSVFGSDYSYSDLQFDIRHYLELFDGVVLANKLNFESIQGSAPFWDLSIIGGSYGPRGYHLNRFRGNQSILHLLELRTWLFSFWNDRIQVGSQLFWDSGRVFSDNDSNELFNNWKHSFGGGMICKFFSRDIMLRADAGISEESLRFYFGAGYVF
ncbi:MAG: BamA/TamA family outer membrane protein [Balneolaceae bacterium]|nr:BamA/TamA family outer membrane protein [Balneolaceae bacterium]